MDDWKQEPYEMVSLGPMNAEEREELLAVAEELRARNIDPVFYLRALFLNPPSRRKGRPPADSAEAERDERLLAAYRGTLGLLQQIDRGTPPEATTAGEIREAARIDREGFTLRLEGDGFTPYLEAVAAYREGLRGEDALAARAAMLAFGMDDIEEAGSALRALQARVRRRTEGRATE